MNLIKSHLLYVAWAQAMAGVVGSLYFSEIAGFTPCVLCWWQRILMYPLVIIIAVGILKKDYWAPFYILPFSILGIMVSLYQNALTYGWLPEVVGSCSATVSCTVRYIDYFGFMTIPFLSLVAFSVITICALVVARTGKT